MVERTCFYVFMFMLAVLASILHAKGRDWDMRLKQVQRDLNESPNKTTAKSSFASILGYLNGHEEGELRKLTIDDDNRYTPP